MSKTVTAYKYNCAKREYKAVQISSECRCFSNDMGEVIRCPHCERRFTYGACYTSRQIHTKEGFGYAVCGDCYKKEHKEEEACE